jgi:hypothetical protein
MIQSAGRLGDRFRPGGGLDAAALEQRFEGLVLALVGDDGELGAELARLLGKLLDIALRRQRLDGVGAGVGGHQLHGIAADRAGRS